ncbi:MAG TPA: hypothetical protein VF163_16755 [Micromonosporaceae bacterium]
MAARLMRTKVRRPIARQFTVRALAPVPDPVDEIDEIDEIAPPDRAQPPARADRRARPLRLGTVRGLGRTRPRPGTVVLVGLLAIALAGLVWAGQRWYDSDQLASAHQAAIAAAKQGTVDFVSISAATVDRDLQRIAAQATGDFSDEFTRGMAQVRQAVVENRVQSTGTVLRAGLVSGDLDSAVVLVAIDASVRNAGAPDGRLSHYRIQVDLTRDERSGAWLIARLRFVG